MATYCYINEDGEQGEFVFPIGKAPKTVLIDGKTAKRDFQAESVGFPSAKGWPLECVASGVNADQSGELRSHLASRGVPTEVTKDGNPIYRNAKHRKKALKARGMIDKSSYL